MKCPNCGTEMEKGWSYCPRCGFRPRSVFGDLFNEIFSKIRREMKEMETSEKDFEAFDISPWFSVRVPKNSRLIKATEPTSSGFSIRIVQSGGKEPQISIKTFGDVDKERIEKQVNQLGYKPMVKPKEAAKPARPTPSATEEPKTDVRRLDSKVLVDIEVPGVKSEDDIEIKELENSVEVKAIAGDKAYFKILTKPEQFSLTKKQLDKGRLHLEFS